MTVRLRTATHLDMPAVGALHHRSRAAAYAGLVAPETLTFGSAEALSEWWAERRRWEADTHRMTVAVAGTDVVGFSYLGPSEDEGVTELYAIHVLPGHEGTGVGRALMADALPRLGPRAVLWVLEGNERARRFYERAGWSPDGVTRDAPMGGELTHQLRYARTAAPDTDFAERAERHRGELRVHCYRMLGSFDEAEDLVQEVFLRAWRGRDGFAGRSSLRTWLYRIATNACLDFLDGRSRRTLPDQADSPAGPWLQPFPGHLWEPVAPNTDDPEAMVVARETLELAFLAAIQHLPPRQRAATILCDVLGWPVRQTAEALDGSVASVNSALQRARATLRTHLPPGRADWAPSAPPTDEDRKILRRYMSAVERGDLTEIAQLLAQDVRATMPPYPEWFADRDGVLAALAASWDAGSPDYIGTLRMLPANANGQLAAAMYRCPPGGDAYEPFGIGVLQVSDGRITEIVAFHEPALFSSFNLPPTLDR